MSATADIAMIVPVLDDLEAVSRLAEQIAALPVVPAEVIVVSGKPDAKLRDLCVRSGFAFGQTHASRGAQLDQGARMASAGILWFVHADTGIAATALAEIEAAVTGGAAGGCFGFMFGGPRSAWKWVVEHATALRVRCGGMVYGDQALFCTREAYFETGGFAHTPLFEEVPLVKALRRRPRRFVVLSTPVRVAPRRYERDGWLRRSLHNRWLAVCYMCGVSPDALDARYRRATTTQGQ